MSTVTTRPRSQKDSGSLVLLCVAAWAIPGVGHLWLGRRAKGLILLVTLAAMFGTGLLLHGRLFPFTLAEPLVGLAAIANFFGGVWYFLAGVMGWGAGNIRAATYEIGNTFLIVAGLLNMLVMLDAYDIALGRK